MAKQLLIDYTPFEITPQMIKESEERNGGRVIVQGTLQRAGSKNQNGRVYPKDILIREVKKYNDNQIKESRALGELDHPESSVVNLANVSHNILETWFDGDDVIGKVEVLGTPSGNILKELLKAGIKLGISSRGLGSVKPLYEEGDHTVEVQPDFELICWDFVSNPSTHGAFMAPMHESVGSKVKLDKYHKVNKIITDIICEMTGVCGIPTHKKSNCKCRRN